MQKFQTADILRPLSEHELKNAPNSLFVSGDIQLLKEGVRVSVVGTRNPSDEGAKRASFFTRALVRHDIIVVSGLARGIDTIAHRTAIESGGKTIAVLGGPLSAKLPSDAAELLKEISRSHLAISQFPHGAPSKRENFPQRNRTMALISDATVIVEAGESSGTRHQGWEALRLGRLVFIMESVANDPNLKWPREMIEYGAQVLSRESMPEALASIPAFTAGGEIAF